MTSIPMQQNTREPEMPAITAWLIRLPILVIAALMLMTMTLVVLLMAFRMAYTERITPGVTAFGVDLGGMERQEAVTLLAGRFTYDQNTVFTFRDGENAWQLTVGELGLSFDVEATVDAALAIGDGGLLDGLMTQADAWFNGEAIAPIIRYDQSAAVLNLLTLAAEINRPAQDATLQIDPQTLQVVSTPGQAGRTLDISATLAQLDAQMLALRGGGEVSLVINETPPLLWNADEVTAQVQAALSAPLTLTATDDAGNSLGPWTISTAQIAALLRLELVENPDGTRHYVPSIDLSGFASALETLAPGLITLPDDGRFNFDETTGQLVVTVPPVPGRALNIEATLARMEEAVFHPDNRTVTMAFDYVQPRYHSGITAAELGITGLVAEATTFYNGSGANRRHNIAVGASKFDGIIIAPNEEFSFNQYVGEISLEAGFKEGLVIVGGATVDGVGGGICQVSTTIFRAALNGGFWISERNTHAYRVHYYEMNGQPTGLDAAIWSPERDLKFINDTPHHILIETTIDPNASTLQFRIYSTPFGRSVEILAPEVRDVVAAPPTRYVLNNDLQPGEIVQSEPAADGMDVTVIRRVTEPDGSTRTDRVFTHYLPWAAVYEVATGDPRLGTGG